jgi:hypothetical protein
LPLTLLCTVYVARDKSGTIQPVKCSVQIFVIKYEYQPVCPTPSNRTQRTCHWVGHPSNYLPGPTLLDFGDQMGNVASLW